LSFVKGGDGNGTTLVVPVDVVGLAIGESDYQQATNGFAGATAVYADPDQSGHAPFLGSDVARGFDQDPWDQLETGVHLHWALPDGLTRGGGPGAELKFPAAPTRWLVTRIAISGDTPTTRSWLIQSDALAENEPGSGSSVTLPVATTTFAQGFAYLGHSHDLGAEGWSEELAVGGPTLAEAAGSPLSVVSNGEVSFAAYYPSCRGVFGFWDPLDDVDAPASAPAQLQYSVIGWYDDPTHDPVQPGATPAQLEAARGWTFTATGAAPSASVYAGTFEEIAWSKDSSYVFGKPVQQPLPAHVAIGNTSAEALAANFLADQPLPQSLLVALQSGILDRFKQPRPDALTEMLERLHDLRFAGIRSGHIYSIVATDDNAAEPQELIDLPTPLADALNQLNVVRRQADQCAFHADWFRWQLFADWYAIFMVDESGQNEAVRIAEARYMAWSALNTKRETLAAAARKQHDAVAGQLAKGMRLRRAPAKRFVQPSDPTVLITGAAVDFPERYGGDGRFNTDGYLVCRTDSQLLQSVAVSGKTLAATDLTGVTAPTGLPEPTLLTALLRESCLLSTTLMANIASADAGALHTALELALEGKTQTTYTLTGQPPSPVGVNWWTADQWLPLFASWTVEYLPLQPTASGQKPVSYGATIVNANFKLDQDAGGTLTYAPSGGSGSIDVDPATAAFTQQYIGAGHLTPSAAQTLTNLLEAYPDVDKDTALSAVLAELTSGAGFLVAPLNGFHEALTMRQQGVQLEVKVPSGNEYEDLTDLIRPVVGRANSEGGPDFDGDFNPLRAGWLKLSLTLVDAFGQKRDVQLVGDMAVASSMTTTVAGTPTPSVAYLAPCVSQPSRLAFNWLAADGSGLEELTGNPATSPVCGWLLPNHLDGSLAIYDQQGRPLGTLFLERASGKSPIGWQSAPGDDATIDEDLQTVMQYQNPQLSDFALALGGPQASVDFFKGLWQVLDTVGDTVAPGPLPTDSDLAVLVGRPIALVQAAVRLELRGAAMLDLGWDTLGTDTDDGLTGVQFPVVLGDLAKLRDGLIGYFKAPKPGEPYDLTTFYSQGADPAATSGVMQPQQDTLCVTPAPGLDPNGLNEPPDLSTYTQQVLMLMDPRAAVHATTGILPTAALTLPSDASQATMSALDLSFFTAPVLHGAAALAIPTPSESGYAVSFIDQDHRDGGALEWVVTAEIGSPSDTLSAYSPQWIREGWLRYNPIALDFVLTDAGGKPVVDDGEPNALTLTVTNRARRTVVFRNGPPVAEGVPPPGSIFYLHFGTLVAQSDVAQIQLSAPGWTFEMFSGAPYGAYWAASPTTDTVLAPAAQITLAVTGLVPSAAGAQAQVTFDYYAIDGIDDGVSVQMLTVEAKTGELA
jgi:hypothetical protein